MSLSFLKKAVTLLRIILLFLLAAGSLYADTTVKPDVTVFEDKSGAMTIGEVIKKGDFTPYDSAKYNYTGVTRSAFWMKVTLRNSTGEAQKRVFSFKNLFLADIWLYDSEGLLLSRYGLHDPDANNDYPFSKIAIAMRVGADASAVYYLRVVSHITINLSHVLRTEPAFLHYMSKMLSFYAFYYGGILVLLIYNFVFFIYSGRIAFLYYVFFALSIARIMLAKNGIDMQFFWKDHPQFKDIFLLESSLFVGIFGLLFIRGFFDTKKIAPRLNRFLSYGIYANLIVLAVIQFDAVRSSDLRNIPLLVMMLSLLFMSAGTLYLYLKFRHRAALILLSGWAVLLGGIAISFLGHYNIIAYSFFEKNISQIASFAELLIFSLALAYSYKQSHEDLKQKERQIRAININLESIIADKTRALVEEVRYKENLLKELSHRVKNSLQVVSGFLSLQTKYCDDQRVKSLLADSSLRIRAMSNIHERLVSQDNENYVEMQGYFEALLEENRQIHGFTGFKAVVAADNIRLLIDQATTVGLIVNEAISNAFKHAFDNIEKPKIDIGLRALDGQMLELYIKDNGSGLADGTHDKQTTLGHKIITSLADQLRADLQTVTDRGFGYILRFERSR